MEKTVYVIIQCDALTEPKSGSVIWVQVGSVEGGTDALTFSCFGSMVSSTSPGDCLVMGQNHGSV